MAYLFHSYSTYTIGTRVTASSRRFVSCCTAAVKAHPALGFGQTTCKKQLRGELSTNMLANSIPSAYDSMYFGAGHGAEAAASFANSFDIFLAILPCLRACAPSGRKRLCRLC